MDRSSTCAAKRSSPMRVARSTSLNVVLRTSGRIDRKLETDARYRRAVSQDTVLWQPKDVRSVWRQSQANSAFDETDGNRSDLSKTSHHLARRWTQDLPVFTAKCGNYSSQPGVEYRYHLPADATRFFVSSRGDGLVQSVRAELATFQYAHNRFLFRGTRRGVVYQATRDIQQ